MNTSISMARACACLLLLASFKAQAQANAADPRAAVPATVYKPAMSYQAADNPATTPDRNWVAGNATVAATNSMQLTMKPRAGQSADPHAGHAMPQHEHQGMQCMQGKEGKMACCESGCQGCEPGAKSGCCGDKMKHGESK